MDNVEKVRALMSEIKKHFRDVKELEEYLDKIDDPVVKRYRYLILFLYDNMG